MSPPFASAKLGGIEFNIEENADYRSPDWAENYIGGRKPISFKTDSLETFLQTARSFGAKIAKEPEDMPWGWREAIISDPDSNEFVIEQKLPT